MPTGRNAKFVQQGIEDHEQDGRDNLSDWPELVVENTCHQKWPRNSRNPCSERRESNPRLQLGKLR
jgi:hypothetical protein